MKLFVIALCLCVLGFASSSPAEAQLAPHGENGVTMGHLHLAAKDPDATRKFFVTLGGTPTTVRPEMIQFPGVFILVRGGDPAPTGGSAGSTVNHVGFIVKNWQETKTRWDAAGVPWEPNGTPKQSYVTSPDGVRVEIIEDTTITTPIKFHHVHFTTEAPPADLQAWYGKVFGAVAGKRLMFDAADLPGVNLTFAGTKTPVVGTRGRALDHIGFDVKNLEEFCKELESRGVKFDRGYQKSAKPITTTATAFLADPWGTYIELTENQAPK